MRLWYALAMAERITITLPADLVAELDAIARRLKLSRSGVVREASARYVVGVTTAERDARRRDAVDELLSFLDDLRACTPLDDRPVADILRETREGTAGPSGDGAP